MGYGVWLHGEAVAAGMVLAAKVALHRNYIEQDYVERIVNLLTNAKLPQDFFKIMIHDKKVKNGSIRYVLPTGFGKSAVFSDVPEELVVRAIEG